MSQRRSLALSLTLGLLGGPLAVAVTTLHAQTQSVSTRRATGSLMSRDLLRVDALFSMLEGRWHGTGELMGRSAVFEMEWEIRPGELATLSFSNGFVSPDGRLTPVLDAVAVYRTTPSRAEAVWLDSRGERIEIEWEAADSTLTSAWSSGSESGRTVYSVVSANVVMVTDEVQAADGWRPFGRATYRRLAG